MRAIARVYLASSSKKPNFVTGSISVSSILGDAAPEEMRDDMDGVLDEKHWRIEAQAVINDVKMHVQSIKVSERLTSTNKVIYLNLTTLEGLRFCVELSASGFTIVGNRHDDVSNTDNVHFETPYSLLEYVSPRYRESFGLSLLNKLKELKNQQ